MSQSILNHSVTLCATVTRNDRRLYEGITLGTRGRACSYTSEACPSPKTTSGTWGEAETAQARIKGSTRGASENRRVRLVSRFHLPLLFSSPADQFNLATCRKRVDGKFLGSGGSAVPQSQAICTSLLEECFDIAQEIKARTGEDDVAGSLKPIYDRLWDTRVQLESLLMTHRWTLRETDLYNYSQSLKEIDKLRVDGKFIDPEGNKPSGQYVSRSPLKNCSVSLI